MQTLLTIKQLFKIKQSNENQLLKLFEYIHAVDQRRKAILKLDHLEFLKTVNVIVIEFLTDRAKQLPLPFLWCVRDVVGHSNLSLVFLWTTRLIWCQPIRTISNVSFGIVFTHYQSKIYTPNAADILWKLRAPIVHAPPIWHHRYPGKLWVRYIASVNQHRHVLAGNSVTFGNSTIASAGERSHSSMFGNSNRVCNRLANHFA